MSGVGIHENCLCKYLNADISTPRIFSAAGEFYYLDASVRRVFVRYNIVHCLLIDRYSLFGVKLVHVNMFCIWKNCAPGLCWARWRAKWGGKKNNSDILNSIEKQRQRRLLETFVRPTGRLPSAKVHHENGFVVSKRATLTWMIPQVQKKTGCAFNPWWYTSINQTIGILD